MKNFIFRHQGEVITPSRNFNYLGIWIDDNLIFGKHVLECKAKAEMSLAALTKVMPNVGGPGSIKRRVLYGSPICVGAMKMGKYRDVEMCDKGDIGISKGVLVRGPSHSGYDPYRPYSGRKGEVTSIGGDRIKLEERSGRSP